MKIIAIVGSKNTGKTSLSIRIIEELVDREYKVGSIKHSHHPMEVDTAGKDTWKHAQAGSEMVVGSGANSFMILDDEMDLDNLLFIMKSIKNPDYVVVEGYKQYPYANISTSDFKDDYTIKQVDSFNLTEDDICNLVDLIEERSFGIHQNLDYKKYGFKSIGEMTSALTRGEAGESPQEADEIVLGVDGKIIPLNDFVRAFLESGVKGMVDSLKTEEFGAENLDNIQLLIQSKKK
ncbi:molybdopterin-guanine dinucleotide biosynthesis protein B [Methanobacterium alcaliphilum]|uniref:molybdopterin-guanine dinucleotide biosynthesis protein B n=1 Tax=Methanobacterium alcaliphilum TaxID=392018 RepID=UPI00200A8E17|nr:molybdopterin-guanine dinucleotide biosynthesis protein B [Methanobacterium alcaliphilum]MCK9151974.1 molybdopterin-guanine dinucleotide biosynthesis protein B [Methanobacterium alcaliphilum]